MPLLETSGATLFYTVAGDGPPVLLIQGVGAIGNAWQPQISQLSGTYRVAAFDNRGIGGSTIRDGRLTIEDMAADALAIADAIGLRRFHLAGHSMGGVIAQAVAFRAPERVLSLAFLCTFARGKEGATMSLPMLVTALRMRIGTKPMRRNAFLGLIMPERYLREVDRAALATQLAPLFGHDLADQAPITMKQLGAMAKYDASARLGALRDIPTLVVAAAEDRIALPRYNQSLAAAIPGARYVEIADAGHGVTIHRASAINRLLDEHFRRCNMRTAPAVPTARQSPDRR
jgi:pimeloyl-ACP methyl ester carboxylesterase